MSKKDTIVITVLVVMFLIFLIISFLPNKNIEIVEVGEIPQAFNFKTTKLPIKEPKKLKITNTITKSEITDKTIYLTFDDGPSYLTPQILDILKQEQVSATFFVVGTYTEMYPNIVKRAYEEGHTIALHANTHNYSYIYSSDENYFNDLENIKTKVYKITGVNSRIIRLPGGSSNTVSKKYNEQIITRITNKLNDNEYYYFDWNVDSGDASGRLSKDQIIANTISSLHYGENIVLMHDSSTKATTLEALPEIINYAKTNGYSFARITKKTRTVHHHINN